jgi:galacturan 1,4-alpha-galacturonidase
LSNAWKDACAAIGSSKVVVPAGTYKLGLVSLKGPCKTPIEVQVEGTLQAPVDPGYFKGSDGWVVFERIDQFTLSGSGSFDGQGQMAWKQNDCSKTFNCKTLAVVRFQSYHLHFYHFLYKYIYDVVFYFYKMNRI